MTGQRRVGGKVEISIDYHIDKLLVRVSLVIIR